MNYSKSNAISVFFRAPEPQQPQPEVADDIIHSDNTDPDEDDEYYKKQLSYFDRRSFDNKPPNPQLTPIIKPAQPQSQPGYYPRYKLNTLSVFNTDTGVNILASTCFTWHESIKTLFTFVVLGWLPQS